MKKKKWFSFLLTAVVTISPLPISTWAAGSDSYTVPYTPGHTAKIPFDEFGDAWLGADEVIFQIDGLDKKSLCDLNHYNELLEITMPWDIDITAGTYSTTITFVNTTTGKQTVSRKVKLAVENDFIGSHVINQVIEVNWDSDIVLKFQNGTGSNRITAISKVSFFCMDGNDEVITPGFSFFENNITYDLEKGEIYIPKEHFQDRVLHYGWTLSSYVYIGTLDTFTLANGEQISYASVDDYPNYGTVPSEPIPNEEFVNDNRDFWYFMFTDNFFAGPFLGDVTDDGSVTLSDTLLAVQFAVRIQDPTDKQRQRADLNNSGIIEFADVIAIAKMAIQ